MATGNIVYPGIINPRYMVATRTLGARPDIAIVYATPQAFNPVTDGDATLSFIFNGIPVAWTGCLCDKGTVSMTTNGHFQVFTIMDRRWAWSKAWITRAYNVRLPDGSVAASTQRSVADIARDLFAAIGESVDVSGVSSTEFPEMVFDRDNCVDMLEELLHSRGYVISLNTNNTVTIFPRGVGATIPANDEVVAQSVTLNPPAAPKYITVVGNRTLIQSKLKMVPVGMDSDGQIKLVNSLSYKPTAGWNKTDLYTFNSITNKTNKMLASRTVGRWFQVSCQADNTFNINFAGTNYNPGRFSVTNANQYLPLDDKLITSYTDQYSGIESSEAYVQGTFLETVEDGNPPKQENTAAFTRLDKRQWTLDKKRGIVRFSLPALKKTPGPIAGDITFADVYLTCTYAVHDNVSYVKDRHTRSLDIGGTGEDIEEVDELQRYITLGYTGATVTSVIDNLGAFNNAADKYLQAAQYKYATTAGNTVLYRGIFPVSTDGITLQIRWDVAVPGPVPFGTHVTQYSEGLVQLPTDHERAIMRRSKSSANPMTQRKRRYHRTQKEI